MKKRLKWTLWGFIALVILSYSIYAKVQPLRAELLEVKPKTVAKTFTEEGRVVPSQEREIYNSQGGEIIDFPAKEGKEVKKGDLLLRLDTGEIDYQIRQLQGQLTSLTGQERQASREPYAAQRAAQELAVEQARTQWEAARKDFDRVKALFEEGALSQMELELAERSVKQTAILLAQQEQALKLIEEQQGPTKGTREQFSGARESIKAQIALLEYQKARGTIYAPMDGVVRDIKVKEGTVIPPGTPVLALFRPEEYEVEVFLLTEDVSTVKPGIEVKITQDNKTGDVTFDGVVAKIAPAAQEKISALGLVERRVKVTVSLKGDVTNLRPGYALDVEFTILQEKDRLAVPKTVLFPKEAESEALWVVRDGKAHIQPIKKGFETDEEVVITEGLRPGDLVITNPQLEGLKEGKRVKGL